MRTGQNLLNNSVGIGSVGNRLDAYDWKGSKGKMSSHQYIHICIEYNFRGHPAMSFYRWRSPSALTESIWGTYEKDVEQRLVQSAPQLEPLKPTWAAVRFMIMSVLAGLGYFIFNWTLSGLITSFATAVGRPLIERFLIEFGKDSSWGYEYTDTGETGFFPLWILPVYFLGGPAVGNLARGIWKGLDEEKDSLWRDVVGLHGISFLKWVKQATWFKRFMLDWRIVFDPNFHFPLFGWIMIHSVTPKPVARYGAGPLWKKRQREYILEATRQKRDEEEEQNKSLKDRECESCTRMKLDDIKNETCHFDQKKQVDEFPMSFWSDLALKGHQVSCEMRTSAQLFAKRCFFKKDNSTVWGIFNNNQITAL